MSTRNAPDNKRTRPEEIAKRALNSSAYIDSIGSPATLIRLRRNTKTPHGSTWQTTTDSATVARWLDSGSNVGIVTGPRCVVLDIDGPEGSRSLAALEYAHGALPHGPTATTRRGSHRYFAPVPNLRNSAGKIGPNLDIRAEGGYVVAPPSLVDGHRYQWATRGTLPPMPAWLQELALDQPRPASARRPHQRERERDQRTDRNVNAAATGQHSERHAHYNGEEKGEPGQLKMARSPADQLMRK